MIAVNVLYSTSQPYLILHSAFALWSVGLTLIEFSSV